MSALAATVYADAQKAVAASPSLRIGQAIFNALYHREPMIADIVRGSDLDPFYRDEVLPDFWAWLAGWEQ